MIVRSKQKSRGFYMLENSLANDPGISWAAKGMLVFLLAKPDEWRVCVEALVNFTLPATPKNVGKDGVYSIIKELVAAGYMTKHKHRDGTLDYMVYDERQIEESADRENPDLLNNQQNGNFPNRENPDREIPPLVKTDLETKTVKALKKTKRSPRMTEVLAILPEWLAVEDWEKWVTHRKQLGKPMTPLAAEQCLSKLVAFRNEGYDPKAIIENCVALGYRGLFVSPNTTKTVGQPSRFNLKSMDYGKDLDSDIPF